MKKFFKEFGTFISKGNALDLAVGIIIGTAFNKIISSLVKDIFMPIIGLIFRADVSHWLWAMRGTASWDGTSGAYILSEDAIVLYYGNFIQTVLDFLIVALAVFLAVKIVSGIRAKLDAAKKLLAEKLNAEKDTQE
ncbi:MAG: large conductance mechanosensitive channel protein MscL [bacterium]